MAETVSTFFCSRSGSFDLAILDMHSGIDSKLNAAEGNPEEGDGLVPEIVTEASKTLPAPVVVWLDPTRPEFGTRVITTVPDGLAALNRHGIDDAKYGPHAQLWRDAATALNSASIEPNPNNLRLAFDAMLRLVKRVAPVPTRVRVLSAPRGLRERVLGLLAPSYGRLDLAGPPSRAFYGRGD
ncbi:hypothetical protein HCU64_12745 [Methylobacterium sp. C25]|uniref:hypothetical protein n=1 Tax=Methylobacterium sp. C25 TaxID=2721622 RepID=UPI001F2CB432|nr:hypothetical protein [Methylobacterium sp. C25]MCE4224625.1 hypothetical protein [Methylobacterium sp. C25]